MKIKIIIFMFFLFTLSFLFSVENNKEETSIKKIVNKDTELVNIEVKRPDNASLIAKKKTIFKRDLNVNIKPIIKKSNKLLY